MSLETYIAFAVVCIVATVSPGPTNMLIVANGMRYGTRAGLMNVAGTLLGVSAMIVVAGIGLTWLIELAGQWFTWVKLVGAAYLCWIGWKMIRASGEAMGNQAAERPRRGFFFQGLFVSLGNPKQLLFFGALMPQFIDPTGNHLLQIAVFGATALLCSTLSDGSYALAAGSLGRRISARAMRLVGRIGGGLLVGGGLWLAFSRAR